MFVLNAFDHAASVNNVPSKLHSHLPKTQCLFPQMLLEIERWTINVKGKTKNSDIFPHLNQASVFSQLFSRHSHLKINRKTLKNEHKLEYHCSEPSGLVISFPLFTNQPSVLCSQFSFIQTTVFWGDYSDFALTNVAAAQSVMQDSLFKTIARKFYSSQPSNVTNNFVKLVIRKGLSIWSLDLPTKFARKITFKYSSQGIHAWR